MIPSGRGIRCGNGRAANRLESRDDRSTTARAIHSPRARPLLSNKLFWVGLLYFAEGFPLGVFYEIFPVYFRQQGIELRQIGVLSLLGLAWTLKFLWAPAIDYWRHHRRWMAAVDVAMGAAMLYFAVQAGFGPTVWVAIGVFTALSATNDVAIDGYTIEYLEKDELGLANGIRIGLYRVGMLASGFVLMASDWLGWHGAFVARRRGVLRAGHRLPARAARALAHDAAWQRARRVRDARALARTRLPSSPGSRWACCGSSTARRCGRRASPGSGPLPLRAWRWRWCSW